MHSSSRMLSHRLRALRLMALGTHVCDVAQRFLDAHGKHLQVFPGFLLCHSKHVTLQFACPSSFVKKEEKGYVRSELLQRYFKIKLSAFTPRICKTNYLLLCILPGWAKLFSFLFDKKIGSKQASLCSWSCVLLAKYSPTRPYVELRLSLLFVCVVIKHILLLKTK